VEAWLQPSHSPPSASNPWTFQISPYQLWLATYFLFNEIKEVHLLFFVLVIYACFLFSRVLLAYKVSCTMLIS
jgi:hypothetical protein